MRLSWPTRETHFRRGCHSTKCIETRRSSVRIKPLSLSGPNSMLPFLCQCFSRTLALARPAVFAANTEKLFQCESYHWNFRCSLAFLIFVNLDDQGCCISLLCSLPGQIVKDEWQAATTKVQELQRWSSACCRQPVRETVEVARGWPHPLATGESQQGGSLREGTPRWVMQDSAAHRSVDSESLKRSQAQRPVGQLLLL